MLPFLWCHKSKDFMHSDSPLVLPTRHVLTLDFLVVPQRQVFIACVVEQQRQSQLGQLVGAATPREPGRAMVPNLQVQQKRVQRVYVWTPFGCGQVSSTHTSAP